MDLSTALAQVQTLAVQRSNAAVIDAAKAFDLAVFQSAGGDIGTTTFIMPAPAPATLREYLVAIAQQAAPLRAPLATQQLLNQIVQQIQLFLAQQSKP
jgi:hypothetical protein